MIKFSVSTESLLCVSCQSSTDFKVQLGPNESMVLSFAICERCRELLTQALLVDEDVELTLRRDGGARLLREEMTIRIRSIVGKEKSWENCSEDEKRYISNTVSRLRQWTLISLGSDPNEEKLESWIYSLSPDQLTAEGDLLVRTFRFLADVPPQKERLLDKSAQSIVEYLSDMLSLGYLVELVTISEKGLDWSDYLINKQ